MLLAAFYQFDWREFEKVARLMLVMAVRYSLICSFRTGALEIRYAEIAHKISQGSIKRPGAVFNTLKDLYPSDDTFLSHFRDKEVNIAKHARYLLRELEIQSGTPELEPTIDPRSLNLEHVAPKQRNQFWRNLGDLKGVEYQQWVSRLGNQTLLETRANREASSKAFKTKLAVFRKSSLKLTKALGKASQWNTDQIHKRQEALAQLAIDRWGYR